MFEVLLPLHPNQLKSKTMGDIMLFVSVIIIVFGILQIILFFKMWGMTNDVEKLKGDLNKLTRHFCDDDEERAQAYFEKGDLYRVRGNIKKAIECYNKTLEFDSEYASAYHMLADTYQTKDMLDEALLNANKAIALMSRRNFFGTRYEVYGKLAEKETDPTKKNQYLELAKADMDKYNELYNQY